MQFFAGFGEATRAYDSPKIEQMLIVDAACEGDHIVSYSPDDFRKSSSNEPKPVAQQFLACFRQAARADRNVEQLLVIESFRDWHKCSLQSKYRRG
jgi:hypothetical protein